MENAAPDAAATAAWKWSEGIGVHIGIVLFAFT